MSKKSARVGDDLDALNGLAGESALDSLLEEAQPGTNDLPDRVKTAARKKGRTGPGIASARNILELDDPTVEDVAKNLFALQCAAMKRDGTRCGNRTEPGSAVCLWHGGGTPLAKAQAKRRIQQCVGPALNVLCEAMQQADWPIAVKAAQVILDRAGYGPHATLEVADKRTDDLEKLDDEQLERRALTLANMLRDRQQLELQRAAIDAELADPQDPPPDESVDLEVRH